MHNDSIKYFENLKNLYKNFFKEKLKEDSFIKEKLKSLIPAIENPEELF